MPKFIKNLITICFSLFCLIGSLQAEESKSKKGSVRSTKQIRPTKIIQFKETEQGNLNLHFFLPKDFKTGQKRPAVVFFFGGGWVGGSPVQFYPHSQHLSDRGIIAIAAEYRVKKKHKTTPFECVEDGKSAIRWVRKHASDWNIDPERIASAGGSAGGHVAASTSLISNFDLKTEDLSISSKPQALILFNPVIDTTKTGWNGGPRVLGKRAKELSPLHYVTKSTPPAIIFHGTADTTVPFENVERFQAIMKQNGNRAVLHPYEGRKHAFFNRGKDETDYLDTVTKMDAFLVSLGWLDDK